MRKNVILLFFCSFLPCLSVFSQTENERIPIVSWKISERLGNITPSQIDTVPLNFQNKNITDAFSTAYGYTGNLMLPGQSKIFFDRGEQNRFIFADGYAHFVQSPGNFNFTNTKIPFTQLSYFTAGSSTNKEERFSGMFSANFNKKWNIGMDFDYIYAKGYYVGQSAKMFDLIFFSNYLSDKYVMHTFWGIDNLVNYENGGISDDRYITSPESAGQGSKRPIDSKSIPVNFQDEVAKVKNRQFYLNQRYNVGYYRRIADIPDSASVPVNQIDALSSSLQVKGKVFEGENDSIGTAFKQVEKEEEFVPVTSFIWTAKYTYDSRYFITKTIPKSYYQYGPYVNSASTRDSTNYSSLRNTFGISLLEGFNKYAKAGLSVFIENEIRTFHVMDSGLVAKNTRYGNSVKWPTTGSRRVENATSIGAELSKRQGTLLNYNFTGELGVLGDDLGQFKLQGNIQSQFKLWKDTVQLRAYGYIKNLKPSYYLNTYHSNFFWWNNNFSDQRQVRIGGNFAIPTREFNFNIGVENLQNYIYFDKNALPAQTSNNIQVLSATLNQNFRFGILNSENELVYQTSSNKDILPLPDFSIYSNLYLLFKFVKVMTVQIGADFRYHTEYYAPAYQPATTQFYLQDEVKIGNSPLVNVYANMYLKKTRFFIMAYNVAPGNHYFSLPHYPLNPFHIRMGLSISFID